MKQLIGLALAAFTLNNACAQAFVVPQDAELMAGQKEGNIAYLRIVASATAPYAKPLLSGFAVSRPDQFVIVRVPNDTLALARWGEHHAVIKPGFKGKFVYREVAAAQWRAAFQAIAAHPQQPPAEPKRDKYAWKPGFQGIAHVRDQEKERSYLLSTADIFEYQYRNAIDVISCKLVPYHCRSGDDTGPGWIVMLTAALLKAPGTTPFENARLLCQHVAQRRFDDAAQLLADGADIDAWQPSGRTCYGQLNTPEQAQQRAWLVEHKASVSKPDFLGGAPD